MTMGTSIANTWEQFLGGTPEAEAAIIKDLVKEILFVQADLKARSKAPTIRRAFHTKAHAGLQNAQFRVDDNPPEEFRVGLFQPGKEYRATIRLSNASGIPQLDKARDLRGLAVRLHLEGP